MSFMKYISNANHYKEVLSLDLQGQGESLYRYCRSSRAGCRYASHPFKGAWFKLP